MSKGLIAEHALKRNALYARHSRSLNSMGLVSHKERESAVLVVLMRVMKLPSRLANNAL